MTWGLARGEAFLPRTSLYELKRLMAAETETKPRLRLLIAMHRKQGKSLDEITDACGVPRRTVHGALERFRERGVGAAHAVKQSGRPDRLTVEQLRNLRKRLLRSPLKQGFNQAFWTTRMIVALVKREYGVAFTPQWMWALLCRLGFSCKKPRPTHYKSSPREVAAFKKKSAARNRSCAKRTARHLLFGRVQFRPSAAPRAKLVCPRQTGSSQNEFYARKISLRRRRERQARTLFVPEENKRAQRSAVRKALASTLPAPALVFGRRAMAPHAPFSQVVRSARRTPRQVSKLLAGTQSGRTSLADRKICNRERLFQTQTRLSKSSTPSNTTKKI